MTAGWKELTLKDILYGVVIPLIVGLIIIAFSLSTPFLMRINPALIGIVVFGLQEVILIVAVPMFFGLLWNQWAGGASGFLLGSIYALWWSDQGALAPGFSSDISLLGYVVSAMLIGYIAGALNKRSYAFSRLLVSGIIAGIAGALFLFLTYQLSPFHIVTGFFGFFITILQRLLSGVIIPIFVKVFSWYGITPKQSS
jgi:hypothetical protein